MNVTHRLSIPLRMKPITTIRSSHYQVMLFLSIPLRMKHIIEWRVEIATFEETFNSFEDETTAVRVVKNGREDKPFNSFEDETVFRWRGRLMLTHLSIPLRMKPQGRQTTPTRT